MFHSSLYLLHVVEPAPRSVPDTRFIPDADWDEVRNRGVKALGDMADVHFKGLCVTPFVRQGDAATEITAFAARHNVSMIMMSSHGSERLRVPLLGSVTSRVLNEAVYPVWTAPQAEQRLEIRSLLCGIDLGPESRSLIREAATLGERTGAKVRLAYAVAGEENEIDQGAESGFERYIKNCARVSVASLQHEMGTDFDLCMEAGRPSRVFAAAARHHDVDLTIIGRGRRGGGGRERSAALCGEAYSIVHECHCPVLSF